MKIQLLDAVCSDLYRKWVERQKSAPQEVQSQWGVLWGEDNSTGGTYGGILQILTGENWSTVRKPVPLSPDIHYI